MQMTQTAEYPALKPTESIRPLFWLLRQSLLKTSTKGIPLQSRFPTRRKTSAQASLQTQKLVFNLKSGLITTAPLLCLACGVCQPDVPSYRSLPVPHINRIYATSASDSEGFEDMLLCPGFYIQKLGPLVPPQILDCDDPSQCTLQVITDPASVGVPPANVPAGTVLMTLPANCSCPFPLIRPVKSIRASSFSPQDQYSNIDTPVIAYSPRFGCQVLQHVTTPPEKVRLCRCTQYM